MSLTIISKIILSHTCGSPCGSGHCCLSHLQRCQWSWKVIFGYSTFRAQGNSECFTDTRKNIGMHLPLLQHLEMIWGALVSTLSWCSLLPTLMFLVFPMPCPSSRALAWSPLFVLPPPLLSTFLDLEPVTPSIIRRWAEVQLYPRHPTSPG